MSLPTNCPAAFHRNTVGTSYMIPIVYRYIDSLLHSLVLEYLSVLAYFNNLAYFSVLAYFSNLAYLRYFAYFSNLACLSVNWLTSVTWCA